MSVDFGLLIAGALALIGAIASAIYARYRMEIRIRVAQQQTRSLIAGLADTVDDLQNQTTNVQSSVELLRQQDHLRLSELDALIKKTSGECDSRIDRLQEDFEEQLSVGRVADVEQLAIAATLIAGDSLANHQDAKTRTVANRVHGHALLTYQIALDAAAGERAEAIGGYHVLEIGTTREKWWEQMSTSRLALVCRALAYRMLTIDVDPMNTAAGKATSRFYGTTVDARTARGEVFLEEWEGQLPKYLYVDAYDFEHSGHSQDRQERYRELQGAEINDDVCWAMHLRCAEEFVKKCSVGSVVVFDDAFQKDSEWSGKGKLAVPYMLDGGFVIVAQTTQTVALRRTTEN